MSVAYNATSAALRNNRASRPVSSQGSSPVKEVHARRPKGLVSRPIGRARAGGGCRDEPARPRPGARGRTLTRAGFGAPAAGSGAYPGLGSRAPWHPRAMEKTLVSVRDLTDPDQNQAVLDVASALVEGRAAAGDAAASHGPAVAAEAM